MLLHVYLSAANVGVGVGVGDGLPATVVLVGDDDGGAEEVGEHPASAASVAIARAQTAHRRAIEGRAMVSRIGQ